MSSPLRLTVEQFLAPKRTVPEVDALLVECARDGLGLRASFAADGVTLETLNSTRSQPLTLTGRWRSPRLSRDPESVGALLLAPLMFWVHQLSMPRESLFTMGRESRSTADLLARNYFHAACRQATVHFVSQPSTPSTPPARELLRTYLWIVKVALDEPMLSRPNAPELVVASAHLPGVAWRDPLLSQGVAEFQRITAGADAPDLQVAQKRDALALRDQLMSLLKT